MENALLLEFEDIHKSFPGVRALQGVSFSVRAGEAHALLGENGAGKSTLMKILGGVYTPDSGAFRVAGKTTQFRNCEDALAGGIAIIHQELQYVPHLSVTENLLLGRLPHRFGVVDKRKAEALARHGMEDMGLNLNPRAKLAELSIGQRQMVEICKAVMRDAQIIALDEPTSSLSSRETALLFAMVRRLRTQGKALIYISHRLAEIFEICDSATVLRDGRKVADIPKVSAVSADTLIERMVGRDIDDVYNYRPRELGVERLRVSGLMGPKLTEAASFHVRAGEILGIFGLVGAGRTELMQLLYGAAKPYAGEIHMNGQLLKRGSIQGALSHGLMYCPEDRKSDGIIPCRPVSENINLSSRRHNLFMKFFLNHRAENETADRFIRNLRIKTPSAAQLIRFLSGGNQQKVILARWLSEPDVQTLIMDEPTRGIDIGAKNEIYEILHDLAAKGTSIIMVSSELPEVLGISDRVVVMCDGLIRGILSREEATESRVLSLALPDAGNHRPTSTAIH